MNINLKCPICGKEGSGDVPDDVCKERGLTENQTVEVPCPDCLGNKMVGTIEGVQTKIDNTPLKGTTTTEERVTALLEYHKKMLRKEGEIQPILFTLKGERVQLFMLTAVMDDKDKAEICVKAVLSEVKPDSYYMATEAWEGTDTNVMPSKDPNRKEVLIIYGQGKGESGKLVRQPFTKFDGEIKFTGPSVETTTEEINGRFINLLSADDE